MLIQLDSFIEKFMVKIRINIIKGNTFHIYTGWAILIHPRK